MLHGTILLHDIFLATCLETLGKKSIASCRRHATRCNVGLQLAMVLKRVQSLQEVEPSSTVSVTWYNFLHDIFLATCLETLEKEIHCKFQKTCYMLQCQAATSNGFKTYVQSLQEVEPSSTVSVP